MPMVYGDVYQTRKRGILEEISNNKMKAQEAKENSQKIMKRS